MQNSIETRGNLCTELWPPVIYWGLKSVYMTPQTSSFSDKINNPIKS